MRNDQMINVQELTVTRDVTILDNISWSMKKGENWAILGPNGSGKTTLISVLTAYVTMTSGKITLLGREYGEYDWRTLRKSVGIISSQISEAILPSITVTDLVISGKHAMLNNWFEPLYHERNRALGLLEKYHCAYLAKRKWKQLSVGEKQRVMTARAFMAEPELLIMDEPCAGLDPVARQRFINYCEKMFSKDEAPALVLITHHIDEIIPEITHVMLMKEGQVAMQGRKTDIMTAENLSKLYDAAVMLNYNKGRYYAEYCLSI